MADKLKVIDGYKKAQMKEKIWLAYLEIADFYFSNGVMYRAMEAYWNSSCYSGKNEDVITIGIKIGVSSIYAKDFAYGTKFIKDAILKNEENPTGKQRTNLLNTIQAILYVGQYKYDKVCQTLWENPISQNEDIKHLAT